MKYNIILTFFLVLIISNVYPENPYKSLTEIEYNNVRKKLEGIWDSYFVIGNITIEEKWGYSQYVNNGSLIIDIESKYIQESGIPLEIIDIKKISETKYIFSVYHHHAEDPNGVLEVNILKENILKFDKENNTFNFGMDSEYHLLSKPNYFACYTTKGKIDVFSTPSRNSKKVTELSIGEEFMLIEDNSSIKFGNGEDVILWFKVKISDTQNGWIYLEDISKNNKIISFPFFKFSKD